MNHNEDKTGLNIMINISKPLALNQAFLLRLRARWSFQNQEGLAAGSFCMGAKKLIQKNHYLTLT